MKHRFPLPEEIEMENLIVSVFGELPVAEISRLNRLEERLVRRLLQKKAKDSKHLSAWWILLLISGFASAVWWAGEHRTNQETEITVVEPHVENTQEKPVTLPGLNDNQAEVEAQEKQPSNVIYQRENY